MLRRLLIVCGVFQCREKAKRWHRSTKRSNKLPVINWGTLSRKLNCSQLLFPSSTWLFRCGGRLPIKVWEIISWGRTFPIWISMIMSFSISQNFIICLPTSPKFKQTWMYIAGVLKILKKNLRMWRSWQKIKRKFMQLLFNLENLFGLSSSTCS